MVAILLSEWKELAWAAGLIAVLSWGLWAVHHERQIGQQQVIAADAKARKEEQVKVQAETVSLQAAANQAAGDRDAVQKSFDAYMAAHPVGAVIVRGPAACNQSTGLPGAAATHGGNASAGTGPAAVPQVSTGGRDIGPALDTILRASGALAGLYQQFQAQPVMPHGTP